MIDLGRPVFGICRGFQEMNVAFGGSLARDLGHGDRPLPHHAPVGASTEEMFGHAHEVTLTPGEKRRLMCVFHTDADAALGVALLPQIFPVMRIEVRFSERKGKFLKRAS